MNKHYIGGGVYVEFKKGRAIVTTEDGIAVTNAIYLDRETWLSLKQIIEQHLEAE